MLENESELFSAIVSAPFGFVGVRTEAAAIHELVYLQHRFSEKAPTDKLAEKAARQIEKYLVQPDFRFNLPLKKTGSEFQHRVWNAISSIPRGKCAPMGKSPNTYNRPHAQWGRRAAQTGIH